MSTSAALSLVLGLGIVFVLVAILIAGAAYVAYCLPLYQMASRAGIANAWLAWIPIGNMYILTMLSRNQFNLFNQIKFDNRVNAFALYIGLSFGAGIVGAIPLIGGLLSFACWIALILVQWRLINDLMDTYNSGNDNTVLSVLSAIIPIVLIVVLWMYRNNTPNYNN